jgi:lysophospholipase L1-like esterase
MVLILLGSNDCKLAPAAPIPAAGPSAAARLADLTALIFALLPGTTIIVAQLPPLTQPSHDANVQRLNADLVPLLAAQRALGYRVSWVDCHGVLDVTRDMSDDTHPNDAGFEKIAHVWHEGIRDVLRRGWVRDVGEMVPAEVAKGKGVTEKKGRA